MPGRPDMGWENVSTPAVHDRLAFDPMVVGKSKVEPVTSHQNSQRVKGAGVQCTFSSIASISTRLAARSV
jgi:hypothetical protein